MAAELNRKLVLENGTEHLGTGFGASRDAVCELVFNTAMIGYQEVVSDPGCTGQMVLMTYPLIGNYGMTDDDYESRLPTIGGLVVREYNDLPSNFRATKTLGEILEENNIPGIQGVDTRQICRMLRKEGTQRALLCNADMPLETAMKHIRAYSPPADLVSKVSCKKNWYARTSNPRLQVVAVDCGIKSSIVRRLKKAGCNVTIVPYNTSAENILSFHPNGVIYTGGPGTVEHIPGVVEEAKKLLGKVPLFGIALGHQVLSVACGAKIIPLKQPHNGGNHPVRDLRTQKVIIASQGHSHAVDPNSLEGTGLVQTHVDLLDNSCQGVASTQHNLFSVQYQPESAPGPQDSLYLFDDFVDMMEKEAL